MRQERPNGHDPYAALRLREYRLFSIGRNLSGLGEAMQSVAIGWELFARTQDSMTLGWVGLVQTLPIFLFALPAGHVADRHSRKRIAILAQAIVCLCSIALALLSVRGAGVSLFLLCLFCSVSARAFGNPARSALLPQVVPAELMSNAVSWDTSIRRIAVMVGAAFGGWLLAQSDRLPAVYLLRAAPAPGAHLQPLLGHPHPAVVYLTTAALGLASAVLLTALADHPNPGLADYPQATLTKERPTWKTLLAGISYIRHTQIILATISLDLFAVLLGGATSLLPVYASAILHVGPRELGWMRAATSAGALLMALASAHLPPYRYPGRAMLWAVAGFGLITVVFGFSRSLPLSLTALFLLGALDMISVVVRQTLVQTLTPNAMRGRVNAVNSVFINSSNELGDFESGVVARWTTPTFSVVSGGIGSVLVVVAAALLCPPLRHYKTDDPPEAEDA